MPDLLPENLEAAEVFMEVFDGGPYEAGKIPGIIAMADLMKIENRRRCVELVRFAWIECGEGK